MSGQEDRRDFPKWKIDLAYESCEGLCKCGANLEQTGFHVHHIDSDSSNTSLSNIQLLCQKCHHRTFGEENPFITHQKQERDILEKLNLLITQSLDPASKVSGATLEKLVDAMTMSLKVSRNVTEVDYGIQHVPATIKLQRKIAEQSAIQESYLEGWKDGVKSVTVALTQGIPMSGIPPEAK